MSQDMAQYLDLFIQEAREQLDVLEQETLKLEQEPSDERMNAIFRAAHTLKGASRAMDFSPIANLTHEMENVLDLLRSHALSLTTEMANDLLAAVDALVSMCDEVAAGGNGSGTEDPKLVEALKGWGSTPNPSPASMTPPESQPGDQIPAASPELPEEIIDGLNAAVEAGEVVYHGHFRLAEDCILKFARAFMAIGVINEGGELLVCVPDAEALEDETFDRDFQLFFTHASAAEELLTAFGRISELEVVSFCPWQATQAAKPAPVLAAPSPTPAADASPQPTAAVPDAPAEAKEKTAKKAESGQTVRVDVGRLDELMNLVGEMVIDRTRVGQLLHTLLQRFPEVPELHSLSDVVGHLNRVSSSLQENLMKARMLPIETVFARLPRMVRDLAQKTGKQVRLELTGAETELDRSVIEVVGDPLIHILRNCVDHGIEPPELRSERGKPTEGLVQVSASHHENSLVIEISDDGGGIDTARLRRKAVESGLLSQTAADQLPEADALGLIFTSGLSTAAQVSEVSGRGVGMDIVRSNVQRLGGMIDVETQIGKGSTFRLRLPLTLAIIRGLLVKVDGNVFVLPLSTVIETTRIHKSEIKRRHKSEVLVVRERTTPLIRMNRAYPVNGVKVQNSADQYYVVIVGFANQRAGLIVDELIGEQEVVIKPLGKVCGQVPGLSGATILGDGKVALICDMNGLLNGNKK